MPSAAGTVGIDVSRVRYRAMLIAGVVERVRGRAAAGQPYDPKNVDVAIGIDQDRFVDLLIEATGRFR